MERFEIRVCDGFGGFTSIFKEMTFQQACTDAESLHGQMTRMGVAQGRIELRGADDKLVEAHFFTAARDRVAEKRRQARKHAAKQALYDQGFDEDDLRY